MTDLDAQTETQTGAHTDAPTTKPHGGVPGVASAAPAAALAQPLPPSRTAAVTMIQSNFGSPGNLEVICNAGGQLYFFWRDSGPSFTWNGPFPLRATTW